MLLSTRPFKEFRQTKLAHSTEQLFWSSDHSSVMLVQYQFAILPKWNSAGGKKFHSFCQTNAKCIKCKYPQHSHLTLRANFPSVTYQAAWRSLYSSFLRVRYFLNGQQVLPGLCCYLVFSLAVCQRKVFKAYVKKWCLEWCQARPWAVLNPSYVCWLLQSCANSHQLSSCPAQILLYP